MIFFHFPSERESELFIGISLYIWYLHFWQKYNLYFTKFVILVFLVPYLLIYLLWCLIKFNMNTKLYFEKKYHQRSLKSLQSDKFLVKISFQMLCADWSDLVSSFSWNALEILWIKLYLFFAKLNSCRSTLSKMYQMFLCLNLVEAKWSLEFVKK